MGMLGIHPKDGIDTGPGLTKQSMRDEVDINKIVARFAKTGMLSSFNGGEPFYGDVSDILSYQDALNVVVRARELFDGLPAELRERFANDPARLISFLDNPANKKEAIELGIVQERPVDDVKPAVVDAPKS